MPDEAPPAERLVRRGRRRLGVQKIDEGLGESIDQNSEQSNSSPKLLDKFTPDTEGGGCRSKLISTSAASESSANQIKDVFAQLNEPKSPLKRVTFL